MNQNNNTLIRNHDYLQPYTKMATDIVLTPLQMVFKCISQNGRLFLYRRKWAKQNHWELTLHCEHITQTLGSKCLPVSVHKQVWMCFSGNQQHGASFLVCFFMKYALSTKNASKWRRRCVDSSLHLSTPSPTNSLNVLSLLCLYGECPLENGLLQSWMVVCQTEGLLDRKAFLGIESLKRLIITSPWKQRELWLDTPTHHMHFCRPLFPTHTFIRRTVAPLLFSPIHFSSPLPARTHIHTHVSQAETDEHTRLSLLYSGTAVIGYVLCLQH